MFPKVVAAFESRQIEQRFAVLVDNGIGNVGRIRSDTNDAVLDTVEFHFNVV